MCQFSVNKTQQSSQTILRRTYWAGIVWLQEMTFIHVYHSLTGTLHAHFLLHFFLFLYFERAALCD